jgi:hypothetical protein
MFWIRSATRRASALAASLSILVRHTLTLPRREPVVLLISQIFRVDTSLDRGAGWAPINAAGMTTTAVAAMNMRASILALLRSAGGAGERPKNERYLKNVPSATPAARAPDLA